MSFLEEMTWRDMIHHDSDGRPGYTPKLPAALDGGVITGYCGFDPTSKSLHIGSQVPAMGLAHLQKYGHHPIVIVGGGTGMIGDPSGKSDERSLLTPEQVEENVVGIREQLGRFLDFDSKTNPARIINNADWLKPLSALDFLRDVGKHFTVNSMLGKESVDRRMEQQGGLSYTEFSYMLLQAYDFLVLFDQGCTLQIGGSDQWGNITAGIDFIRKVRGAEAHGLVMPLVSKADGTKFGKTESGSIWLDHELTSPYKYYQFWLGTADDDVISYLKYFTFLSEEEITVVEEAVAVEPEKREAQQRLAAEVTLLVHGKTELYKAGHATNVLFGGSMDEMSANDIQDIFEDVPSTSIRKEEIDGQGMTLVDMVVTVGLANSKGSARNLISGGGIYVNNHRITDAQQYIQISDSIDGQVLVVRKGAKEYRLLKIS